MVKYQGRGVPCKLMLYSLACHLPQANVILCPPPSHPVAMPPQYIFPFPLLDPHLLRHMLKRMRQLLLAKRELAGRPNLGILPPPKMYQHPPPPTHNTLQREKKKDSQASTPS